MEDSHREKRQSLDLQHCLAFAANGSEQDAECQKIGWNSGWDWEQDTAATAASLEVSR